MDDDSTLPLRPPADWRPVVAALANRDARAVWARLVVGDAGAPDLTTTRARRAVALLEAAGLVLHREDGGYGPDEDAFRRLLASSAETRPRPAGVQRFLRPDGRIDRYPAGADDRAELLAHVAQRILNAGEIVAERELTERLTRFTDDPVALRRALVDAGLVRRTPSGSEYTLAAAAAPASS